MTIKSVPSDQAPLELLLLADPSAERVLGYIPSCAVLVGEEAGVFVAVAAVEKREDEIELMAIAVAEDRQGQGLGRQMLAQIVTFAESHGAVRITVGTGNSSTRALALYRQNGFEITGVIRDYFKDYDPPIFEDGVRCLDMIRLARTT